MPSPGTTSDGKCAESWNCAVSAASTMSHKSGISEWRQAGPLIALITGTSISRSRISKCRPSQWIRSMRSAGGRVGNDEVPGVARPGELGANAGQDHDPVVAVGADIVERLGQFAM